MNATYLIIAGHLVTLAVAFIAALLAWSSLLKVDDLAERVTELEQDLDELETE